MRCSASCFQSRLHRLCQRSSICDWDPSIVGPRNLFQRHRNFKPYACTPHQEATLSNSAVFPDFYRFRRACPSPKVNAWKFINHGVCYLATPAVAILPSIDGQWKFSNFLDDFKDLDWRMRHSYSVNYCAQDDICWVKYPGDDSDTIILEDSDILGPTKSNVIFRQPYDIDAVWVSLSEMGVTEAILYKRPVR